MKACVENGTSCIDVSGEPQVGRIEKNNILSLSIIFVGGTIFVLVLLFLNSHICASCWSGGSIPNFVVLFLNTGSSTHPPFACSIQGCRKPRRPCHSTSLKNPDPSVPHLSRLGNRESKAILFNEFTHCLSAPY